MKKTYFYILGLMTMALVQSCYEDKGNYDYHAVNELKVEIPEVKVRMPKEEPVMVTLTPELATADATATAEEWLRLELAES